MARELANTAGYLSAEEWSTYQKHLEFAKHASKELARRLGVYELKDSRWPATGIQNRKWFRQRRVKVTLNPEYLNDKRVDYQLTVHDCVYVPFLMFYRSLAYKAIRKYSIEEMENKNQLLSDIEKAMQEKVFA